MSEELEDALRRELRAESVPFDESRADDMIRSVTESRLAGAPRAWLAPLAAAASVVVVGGGIALATSGGGGGNSAAGPERAGGVGSSANTGGSGYGVADCGSFGSDAPTLSVVGTAVPVEGSSAYSVPVPERTYTAIASATVGQYLPAESASEPDRPPYPPTVSSTAGTSRRALGPREMPATATPASVALATELPPPTGSDAPVETGLPSDVIVICAVGTASPGSAPGEVCTESGHGVTCSGSYCRKSGHGMTCLGSGTCAAPQASSSGGPYNSVLCVDPPSVGYATVAPSKWPLSYLPTTSPTVGQGPPDDQSFDLHTDVQPGATKTFDGPDIPAGQVLVVESATMLNPAADHGTFSVSGDAAHRFTLQLSDQRSLVWQFDSPPTFDADHPLRVTVDCANATAACSPELQVTARFVPAPH